MTMRRCPLKEAWQASGADDAEVAPPARAQGPGGIVAGVANNALYQYQVSSVSGVAALLTDLKRMALYTEQTISRANSAALVSLVRRAPTAVGLAGAGLAVSMALAAGPARAPRSSSSSAPRRISRSRR